jgi:hypothetical protein
MVGSKTIAALPGSDIGLSIMDPKIRTLV